MVALVIESAVAYYDVDPVHDWQVLLAGTSCIVTFVAVLLLRTQD
jgi:hypothetical protein